MFVADKDIEGGVMKPYISIFAVAFILLAGISFGQSMNLFSKANDDIYIEGWYQVDKSKNLTGLLTIDIINKSVHALKRLDYSGIPDFEKCSVIPANWTCQYDSDTKRVTFLIENNLGTLSPSDRVNFTVVYKNSGSKVLSGNGFIEYEKSGVKKKLGGLTRVVAAGK